MFAAAIRRPGRAFTVRSSSGAQVKPGFRVGVGGLTDPGVTHRLMTFQAGT